MFIGLESFSTESLLTAGKQINRVADYKKIIENIHKHKIMIQAGIVFGFDTDTVEVFENTLSSCEQLGIDSVTASILTPLPRTPIYEQMRQEGRLMTEDWSKYDGKTQVAYIPKNMSAKQLFGGYIRFRKRFYSLPSFVKRMKVSKTSLLYNLFLNLGYFLAIQKS